MLRLCVLLLPPGLPQHCAGGDVPFGLFDGWRHQPAADASKCCELRRQAKAMVCNPVRRGNFLYDQDKDMLHLIDFGASREFPLAFVAVSLRASFLNGPECSLTFRPETAFQCECVRLRVRTGADI